MRLLGRWMLNEMTVQKLLLCAVKCVLWVRSYRNNAHVRQRLGEWKW